MEALMPSEAGRTVARHLAMLRRVPRSPLKTTSSELEARLRDDGYVVSRRTIERDLHMLADEFPLIIDDRSKPYGWSWARDARVEFMPRLADSQAVALLLARSHLTELLPQSMLKELAPIFDLALKSLSATDWKDWHAKTAVVPLGMTRIPPKLSPSVLATVQSATTRARKLELAYRTKGSRRAKHYRVHPLGLLVRGPVIYLVCTLFDYEDIRELALHRVDSAVEAAEPSRRPENFDFNEYARNAARRFGCDGSVRLVARFNAIAAEHLRETPLSKDQSLTDLPDGRVELAATVQNDDLLRWWLLGFGQWVEVIAPAELRREMAEELHRAGRQYEKTRNDDSRPRYERGSK